MPKNNVLIKHTCIFRKILFEANKLSYKFRIAFEIANNLVIYFILKSQK